MQDDIVLFKINKTYRHSFLLTALTYKSLLRFLLFLCFIMSKYVYIECSFLSLLIYHYFCLLEYARIVNVATTAIDSRVLTFVKDMPTKKKNRTKRVFPVEPYFGRLKPEENNFRSVSMCFIRHFTTRRSSEAR